MNKNFAYFLLGMGAILVFLLVAFFVPALRLPANILIIVIIVSFCVLGFGALFGYSIRPTNPNVPDYAITLGERQAKANREGGMGCSIAFGVFGAIAFLIGLFLGWGQFWWYELVGMGILIVTVIIFSLH